MSARGTGCWQQPRPQYVYTLRREGQIAHNTEAFIGTAVFADVTSETLFGIMVKLIRAENDQ